MSLHITASDSLHLLAYKLHEQFKQAPIPVFQPRLLVTQTVGMNNWLKIQLATHNQQQIAANLQFLSPADVLHKVYAALGGQFPDKLSTTHIGWILYTILGERSFQEKFPSIAQYYLQDDQVEQKQMALAEKITDLLDQYQVYRPKMMAEWNQRSIDSLTDVNDWQIYLWLRAREMAGDRFLDRTQQGRDIQAFLKDPARVANLQSRLPEMHLFGLSILTQYHIEILHELATHIDIHFYLLNPAPEQYWYSDISDQVAEKLIQRGKAKRQDLLIGNPLLLQWGTVVKDSFALLFTHEAFLNQYETLLQSEPIHQTLLTHIQQEIRQNIPESERSLISPTLLTDGSITIQSNYTPAREVEALYNYLVQLIDQRKENLSARDIVVMVTNIDEYAPYIKAAFDYAPYTFPYTIADERITSSDNVMQALSEILRMDESGFTSERVMQLLEHHCVRKKFNLQQFDQLRNWVDRVNIRFGFYGDPAIDTPYISWKHGIRRIMLGICMGHTEPIEYESTIIDPFIEIEGADAWEAIRFCQAIEVLIALIEQRKQDRSIEGWIAYTRLVIQQLISLEEDETDEAYQSLEAQLDQYAPVFDTLTQPFSYAVFAQHFLLSLQNTTRSKAFAGSGITFCSPVPMRSIPFKVVAFLGLDFDAFPRKEVVISFDLMQENKQKGDRNLKLNDKHLFLETILSAQEYLYLSYIGRDSKDNSPRPPSALVDELLDYIENKLETPRPLRTDWVVQQPLHSFSKQYNQHNPILYSYTLPRIVDQTTEIWMNESSQLNPIDTISLRAFETYFSKPATYYAEQVLGIRLKNERNLLPETELFELDSLSKWKWQQALLTTQPEHWSVLVDRGIRTGALPLANLGRQVSSEIEQNIQSAQAWLVSHSTASPRTIPISIRIADLQIEGELNPVYDEMLMQINFSSSQIRNQIQFYIRYLMGIASGVIQSSWYYFAKENQALKYRSLHPSEAISRLEELVQDWKEYGQKMPCIYPSEKDWNKALASHKEFFEMIEKSMKENSKTHVDEYGKLLLEKGVLESEDAYVDFVRRNNLFITASRDILTP